jgi:hypothetical protein
VGRAGYFYGRSRGVTGEADFGSGLRGIADNGDGVHGSSETGYGVIGESTSSTGAFFEGGNGIAIELGGSESDYGGGSDDAVIRTEEGQGEGDMILVSNDYIDFHLDDNGGSSSRMRVKNGLDSVIFSLNESGNLTLMGSCSCSSDFNRKEGIVSINTQEILAKVAALSIKQWQFKGEEDRHIGPMAQDFYAAFGLGQGDTTIATVDADGVALAAIQALKTEVDNLKNEIASLREILEYEK